MHLTTMQYLEPQPAPVSGPPSGVEDLGWTEVTKGLLSVLAGYVLGILNVVGSIVVLYLGTQGFKKTAADATGETFTVLLIGGAVLFFSSLYASYLVLRGKWKCVANAPERGGARWLMFASIVCICAGPVLTYTSGLVGGTSLKPQPQLSDESRLKPGFEKSAMQYATRLRENDLGGYMRLAGGIISPFGPVFFVLFIRAIHKCMGRFVATRLTELYLFFVGLLFVGSLCLLLDPRVRLQTDLLIGLGIGWVVAMVWYFLLILAAVFGISAYLNAPREPART
jgi:hypothetical protein